MKTFKKVVKELTKKNMTISTMESCTGGAVANAITLVPGASDVIKFSAVTYSNEFKIKMGVNKDVIDKYSVYSIETAREMALNISKFTSSNIGIGVTGKLNRVDKNNLYSDNDKVYVCIYMDGIYHEYSYIVTKRTRKENKNYLVDNIITALEILLGVANE